MEIQPVIAVSRAELSTYMVRSTSQAVVRVVTYLVAVLGLSWVVLSGPGSVATAAAVVGLGLVFAHGLELQHQTFHNALFRSKRINRVVGLLLGLPMLEMFTETRLQHLHHHRHAGTGADRFDRKLAHFPSWSALLANAWNVQRIPGFLAAVAGLFKGQLPPLCGQRTRSQVRTDYAAAAAMIGLAWVTAALAGIGPVLLLWLIPWLLVAEPVHFLIGMTEHLGRDEDSPNVLCNARTYRAHALWEYIANYDNYHVEHHAYPGVPAYRLPSLNRRLAVSAPVLELSFVQAVREVHLALQAARSNGHHGPGLAANRLGPPESDGMMQ